MPEQTFRSPNYYPREIDLSTPRGTGPTGVPAGVIGTANKGPAFVPVTVGSFDEFRETFGDLDINHYGPYAASTYLANRSALTYLRVLGAGANKDVTDIEKTQLTGQVLSAGFKLNAVTASDDTKGRHNGAVQFLAAAHTVQANEAFGSPMFTDNDSFTPGTANVVRGMIMSANSSRVMVADGNQAISGLFVSGANPDTGALVNGKFKLIISSTLGNAFYNTDGQPGIRIFTASMNPSDDDYFAKVMNTDPAKFEKEQHLLYADFPVDNELAVATTVGILSGSDNVSTVSGDPSLKMRDAFASFNTRYQSPSSPWFISQPYGTTEYDLFKFESLDDGEYANTLYKIAITDLKASNDDADPFGTFTVMIRDWNDSDTNPIVLEMFTGCNLNPVSEKYIGKVIGDRKVSYNFDASTDSEKRIVTFGKYKNLSKYVRIVINDIVDRGLIPQKTLPFGFRGVEVLNTNSLLTNTAPSVSTARLTGLLGTQGVLSGAILPPVPFRTKLTRGQVPATGLPLGSPGTTEIVSSQYHWGVKFERDTLPLNPNLVSEKNNLIASFTKFLGIKKLDTLVNGSSADKLNNNKFSLAKVALLNGSVTDLTSSVSDHMKAAAYIRNGSLDLTNYTINDSIFGEDRVTLATILAKSSAAEFNRFSPYTKFVCFMGGGFDGTNLLDKDARKMNDKASSFDALGGAEASYTTPGLGYNPTGTGPLNATVSSYMTAIDIMTDPMTVNVNILAMPGIRESFVTEHAMSKVKDYGLACYVLDIPSYDDDINRLYDDSVAKPNVDQVANQFDGRVVDNSFIATYFPDVFIDDKKNNRKVKVPASVAALSALSFNDRVAYPWFAPAGFNRAALDSVSNVGVRLNVSDRDRLSDSRINPIATFPKMGFVIYGQKTLQLNKSALDRVNVRRLLLEVKRVVLLNAKNVVFDQNTLDARAKFVKESSQQLAMIKVNKGVDGFDVVMNETNNTQEDIDQNRLNGRIVVVPTRTFEFVALDFIITSAGVQFV